MASGSTTAVATKAVVNWDVIDKELESVPADFKQPKFYSLKHVVEILSSVNPQKSVSELREREERLHSLVDQVVQGYHSGFAKSIQNYSSILQLFTEAKDQVDLLKKSLAESSRQLGAQSKHLHQQWKKSVQLASSLHMLDDIQSVVDVPAKIDAALADKDWPAAVRLLLNSCAKLAQPELMKVGALKRMRSEMASICALLQTQIMEELQGRIYSHRTASTSAPAQLPSMRSGAAMTDMEEEEELSVLNRAQRTAVEQGSSIQALRAGRSRGLQERRSLHRGVGDSELDGTRHCSSRELIHCLVQIGGLQEAKSFLHLHTRSEVRKLMTETLQAHVESLQHHLQPHASKAPPITRDPTQPFTPRHTVVAAQKLVQSVFDHCLKALANMGVVLEEITEMPDTGASAGLELLRSQQEAGRGQEDADPSELEGLDAAERTDSTKDRSRYRMEEFNHMWEQVQEECQLLLAEVLHAPPRSFRARPEAKGAGRLLDMAFGGPESDRSDPSMVPYQSKLIFTFDITIQGVQLERDMVAQHSMMRQAQSYSKLVQKALGSVAGSAYLVAAVLGPTAAFVDNAIVIITHHLDHGTQLPGGGQRGPQRPPAQSWLRQMLEDYVVEGFLPQVWVDLRGRCTAALENSEAFQPIASLSAQQPSGNPGASRTVLPAAAFAEAMLDEVLGWAYAMPSFAGNLTGVVENIMGRVLEGFHSTLQQATGSCKSAKLAARPDISTIMATEPDAQLLDNPVAFYMPKNPDNFDATSFVSALKSQGASVDREVAEQEILQFAYRERPTSAEQLISSGSSSRLVQLAALQESLDHVADAMLRMLGDRAGGAGTRKSARGSRLLFRISPGSAAHATAAAAAQAQAKEAMVSGIGHMVDRYRSLAGLCIRLLRLEMVLLAAHHLSALTRTSHVCEEDEAREVHPAVAALTRAVMRAAEETSSQLSPAKRAYMLSCVAPATAKIIMWLLPDIREINALGVERMVRTLSVLQPALGTLGLAAGGAIRPEASRAFDKARSYYSLLTLPADELLRAASDKPQRYLPAEWVALLAVVVPGRLVYDSHWSALRKVLDKAYGQSVPMKVAAAFESIASTLQAPVEQIRAATDQITAGLQSGAQQITDFFTGKAFQRGRN